MKRLTIIADDFAGAADCAVPFADRGLPTCAALDADRVDPGPWAILALDSDTRDVSAAVAEERVRELARLVKTGEAIFKKVDSTLRGNLASELRATIACWPADCVVAAPAFPATGRTTVSGRQLIDGRPLEESEFAGQISTSSLPELLAPAGLAIDEVSLQQLRGEGLSERLRQAEAQLFVCDAETEDDLERIARGGLESGREVMWLGSAGLARQLASLLATGPRPGSGPAPAAPLLLVVGSPASATRAQLERLCETTDVEMLVVGDDVPPEEQLASLRACLRAGRDCALTLGSGEGERGHGRDGTGLLASVAAASSELVGGLVLTGGETARAVLEAMSVSGLRLQRELQPGIPLGLTEDERRLPVAIKAGGFGDELALVACRSAMRSPAVDQQQKDVR